MKNTLIILLLCVIAVGIAGAGWMFSRPGPLNGDIARLEAELKDARAENVKLKAALEKQKAVTRGRSLIATPGVPSNPAEGAKAAGSSASIVSPGPTAASGKSGAKAFREMMQAPGMKEIIKQQNIAQMDMLYGRLFESFHLNPEEKENFKQLLAARTSAQTDMGLKLMDESLTPEQKKEITAEYEAAKKTSDDAIHTFLGDEGDYKTFQHWEDTQPERMSLDMMGGRSHFASAGEPLTPEQELKLVDVMATVRKAPSSLPDLRKPENVSSGVMTDEMVQKQLQKYDHDAQTVAQNAAGFLSATQLQALGKMQQQMRAMAEAGLKMSRAMFNGDK